MNGDKTKPPFFLGIEGGGTHTIALLADEAGNLVQRFETGPANLKLLSDAQLSALLKAIADRFPVPAAIAIGLAGARGEPEWARIHAVAQKIWPGIPGHATHDLETALAATEKTDGKKPLGTSHQKISRVLVLSGTGSCAYGKNAAGKTAKVGGWGHILGDQGSGYDIGLQALKRVIGKFDQTGKWPRLGVTLLHRLQFNEPNELIPWVQNADKSLIAALAPEVFAAAAKGDSIATGILKVAANELSADALACAQKITPPKSPVQFVLAGSILLKQPGFAGMVAKSIQKIRPGAMVSSLKCESAWGAVILARRSYVGAKSDINQSHNQIAAFSPSGARKVMSKPGEVSPQKKFGEFSKSSPTELRNPRSMHLDTMPLPKAISLMLSEDAQLPKAILKYQREIEKAVRFITQAFQTGGRLIYIGAGTSGRLGVLDASECPPTFRSDPEMVQGIIAGGQGALWRAVEGAEDDPLAGARSIAFRNVTRKDVVVGIAASGRTPFVWGALAEAKKRGAKTVLLAFNPFLAIAPADRPDLVITPNLGAEILTGSTRLKSGTATKLILNIFTTLAMVRIGKVIGNLMVDVNPSNEKLRDRAIRIVRELQKVDYAGAEAALMQSGWVIKKACARLKARR